MRLRSQKINTKRGFSLVEALLAFSIITLLAGAALGSFHNNRSGQALTDAEASVVRALELARARALSGTGTDDHGIYFEEGQFTAFEGETYSGDGLTVTLPSRVLINETGTEVVFKRLDGTPGAEATITISKDGSTKTVSVTAGGVISSD